MANWCNNRVEFIGERNELIVVKASFQALAFKEKNEGRGQLPTFINEVNGGYFFNIVWQDDHLYYQTKWAPNTQVLVKIAEEYNVGFTYSYDEISNGVFGEASFLNGELTEIDLDADDIGQYEYNEDNGTYRFENRNYESSEDILSTMLERKKATLKQQELNNNNEQ
ncbi:hypothetical protein ACFQZI_06730 [Mucilaginibacter lutimaris]|uniref:YubB ferredoxin-like domain-containing protein n=1 Tax=Mucilaginibacter lutimaris TaxID=931629 RepID=A0ABW2ZEB6_9SPHI